MKSRRRTLSEAIIIIQVKSKSSRSHHLFTSRFYIKVKHEQHFSYMMMILRDDVDDMIPFHTFLTKRDEKEQKKTKKKEGARE